tara:strand:- start:1605 stop:2267 length:663 start_codon:yes stop_codon:yes gene_type:complete
MYSFAQRKDTMVIDEPLYAHYLSKSLVVHPGQAEILASQENDGDKVIQGILKLKSPEIVFCKQMTHHLIDMNTDFLSDTFNLIFIREPKAIINSYSKVIPNPKMDDIGIKMQVDLMHELQRKKAPYLVIDSTDLLKSPLVFLKRLCKSIGIPFDQNMLSWKAEPRKEDGVWAEYWYKNVHQSTGFSPFKEKTISLNKEQQELYEACTPYYNELTNHKLTI